MLELIVNYQGKRERHHVWPLLVTWFNFNPGMDKYYTHYNVWDEITFPFLNFNSATVEV